MPVFSLSVEKDFAFRANLERFSNIYTAKHTSPNQTNFAAFANTVANWEKGCFGSHVAFKTVRIWGPLEFAGDGISDEPNEATSQTQYLADLTGNGTDPNAQTQIYRELAVVCRWYLGRSPATGRKRFMRKYYHSNMGQALASAVYSEATAMTSAQQSAISSLVNNLESSLTTAGWTLCAPNGDQPVSAVSTLPNLHIRQLKQ
jgi:hypothetical protein